MTDRLAVLFEAWRDGVLDAEMRAELIDLLTADPVARRAFVAEQRLAQALQIAARQPADLDPAGVAERVLCAASVSGRQRVLAGVMQQVAALPTADHRSSPLRADWRYWTGGVAIAAALCLAVALAMTASDHAVDQAGLVIEELDDATSPTGPVTGDEVVVTALQGDLRIGGDRGNLDAVATVGARLRMPCEIEVGEAGSVSLALADGSTISLGPGSRCGLSSRGGNVVLHAGSMQAVLTERERWVMTPQTLAQLDGASVAVQVSGRFTRFASRAGAIDLRRLADDRALELEPGRTVNVSDARLGLVPGTAERDATAAVCAPGTPRP